MKSPVHLETRTASLEAYWNEFYSRHFHILMSPENLEEDYVVNDAFSTVEDDYITIK